MKDKISLYDMLNKFFIGSIFTILFYIITYDKTQFTNIYNNILNFLTNWEIIASSALFIVMYEIGFILNRSSSVFIAPILEKSKLWPNESYSIDISEIKKVNETFNAMITELVVTRSHILIYLLLMILSAFYNKLILSCIFALVIIILIVSGRKHNNRINKIRKEHFERKQYENKVKQEIISFNRYDESVQTEETSEEKNE